MALLGRTTTSDAQTPLVGTQGTTVPLPPTHQGFLPARLLLLSQLQQLLPPFHRSETRGWAGKPLRMSPKYRPAALARLGGLSFTRLPSERSGVKAPSVQSS